MKKTKSGRRGQGFRKSAKVYGWVRKRLTTDVTFEKGPEVSEGRSRVHLWGGFLGRRNMQRRGPRGEHS